jgi:hypothetical protein
MEGENVDTLTSYDINFNTFIFMQNGVFNKDWNVYVAEKSASISVMACYNVQRSYNREVSSHSLVSIFLNVCIIVKFYYY